MFDILSGGSIEGGRFSGNQARDRGAVYIVNANIPISGVEFTDNVATSHGGAVAFVQRSSGSVANSIFTGNRALSGHGGRAPHAGCGDGRGAQEARFATMERAYGIGGAVKVFSNANVAIEQSLFEGNQAYRGRHPGAGCDPEPDRQHTAEQHRFAVWRRHGSERGQHRDDYGEPFGRGQCWPWMAAA